MSASVPVAPPEPGLTTEEVVARARALRPTVLEQAAQTEANRYYSRELHEAFAAAGLYRMLVPRRYGGYEFDLTTFIRAIVEICRGDMSTGWCLCLGAGHALQIGSWFPEAAQAEIFRDGDFRAAAVAAPVGSARRVQGGWEIDGKHSYCSGIPYSTHYMGQALGPGPDPEGPPAPLLFVVDRAQWTMLDDWGDLLGLKGSGSHSIVLERARIPEHWAMANTHMISVDTSRGTPGYELHGNPMYASPALAFFGIEAAGCMVGAALGALDEYEAITSVRTTMRPPIIPRTHDGDYQRYFGTAKGKLDTALAALLRTCDDWMEVCARVDEGVPFSREDDLRLNVMSRVAFNMAWDAMHQDIFRTAGSSATRDGERLQRIFRDMAMGWGHLTSVLRDWATRELGAEHFGTATA
jgi:3-hydroxy-9,10-secoandrosta-1,3,5(10)-triene-9,17-dione monooxygenase